MKLALQLGYWGAQPPTDHLAKVLCAEQLGFDVVLTAESWGSDAFTPLTWWGAHTTTIRLGTGVVQMSARTPTATAMHALTLDHLSEGRHVLGLGVSGPQVVEGWYGQPFARPLARTRDYVDIVRQVLRRKAPVTTPSAHYPLPYLDPTGATRGKPLKSIVHPRRADLPIWIGSEGPKNVALTAEIADGWIPLYFAPRLADTYRGWLDDGFARPSARSSRSAFEIVAGCHVVVTDERDRVLDSMKPMVALYIGGMGAREENFHKEAFARMGYEREVDEIQRLFLAGEQERAIAAVPTAAVADINLVGSVARIRDELAMWEEAGVTHLAIGATTVGQLEQAADAVLGA